MTSNHRVLNGSHWIGLVAGGAILVFLWIWFVDRPVVLGKAGSQFAFSLLAICNQGDLKRLESFEATLAGVEQTGVISEPEMHSLKVIVEEAKRGSWDTAQREVRKLLESQAAKNSDWTDLD